jgi:hypothetical protein
MKTTTTKQRRHSSPSGFIRSKGRAAGLSRGAMAADICLVAFWGATIPGLMWLAAAGGF